jgi:fructose-bisphosphate aldolase class II
LVALFTTSPEVDEFLKIDIDFLAPSIGNIHGDYGPEGPQLEFDRLERISKQVKDRLQVALHGTNDFSPDIMRRCIEAGAVKLNVNKLLLECWNKNLEENVNLPLMQLIDQGMDILQIEVEKWMDICGSSGKV